MIGPLIALLNTPTYIVALVFTDFGRLRTTLVVTPRSRHSPCHPTHTLPMLPHTASTSIWTSLDATDPLVECHLGEISP